MVMKEAGSSGTRLHSVTTQNSRYFWIIDRHTVFIFVCFESTYVTNIFNPFVHVLLGLGHQVVNSFWRLHIKHVLVFLLAILKPQTSVNLEHNRKFLYCLTCDLLYDTISIQPWYGTVGDWWNGKDFKGSGRGLIKALSSNLSGGTEKNHEKLHARIANVWPWIEPSELKSRLLLLSAIRWQCAHI